MKPQTLMNNSGFAVREAADFYKIAPENILVISDDITLPVGRMRLRRNGSAGGHNGLKSIIAQIGSDAFPRLRMGIGEKPHPDFDLADWVLSEFGKDELALLQGCFPAAKQGIEKILNGDFDAAMQICNSHVSQN
jgi:PTH1 family peptidyl-tRNA hydrolase